MHNPQDKLWWCRKGEELERHFVDNVAPRLGINAVINPEKRENPYAPDLLVDNRLADLKYQGLPYYTSYVSHQVDNNWAVMFNKKDYERYSCKYPDITLYFWVHWSEAEREIGGTTYRVTPLRGVWVAPFADMHRLVAKAPLHTYKNRVGDKEGNARDSYVLDLRDMKCIIMSNRVSARQSN